MNNNNFLFFSAWFPILHPVRVKSTLIFVKSKYKIQKNLFTNWSKRLNYKFSFASMLLLVLIQGKRILINLEGKDKFLKTYLVIESKRKFNRIINFKFPAMRQLLLNTRIIRLHVFWWDRYPPIVTTWFRRHDWHI